MKKPKRLTHLVVKKTDLDTIGGEALRILTSILRGVQWRRILENKNPEPCYIVINTDEPYIDEIVEVLKKHGHWDGWEDEAA